MKKKWIIPIVIIFSLVFNIGYALSSQDSNQTTSWLFVDLGPAVMQDSFYFRSPGLETPYGIIGDIPGGYPLYSGNPLQSDSAVNLTDSSDLIDWQLAEPAPDINAVLLAISFALVPVVLILILGRRSYGSTKTQ
ncbi:MAG: hypothetical protein E4H14_12200 [Candidatus Thorarchaeota archaeon]|nr:MAG: hypothetical protein E4H14_12200 [Candidatus Thorarchaeota archaeon]